MSQINEIIKGMQTASSPNDYWATTDVELPELDASKLIIQRDGKSVWEHTMLVINLLTIKNHITLLSGLFHDLGKIRVSSPNDALLPRFPGHANESVIIAKAWLTEWNTTPYVIDRVIRIISTHMFDIHKVLKEKTIRNFIADVGPDNIDNWFVIRRADSASYSRYSQYKRHIIDPFHETIQQYLNRLPRSDNFFQLPSESSVIMGGKDRQSGDTFLSTKGE